MSQFLNKVLSNYLNAFNCIFAAASKVRLKPFIVAVLMSSLAISMARGASIDTYIVSDFGANGDGKTYETAALQKALDTAAQAGGGVVYAPRGNYFFSGHLKVPNAVTLKGVWES